MIFYKYVIIAVNKYLIKSLIIIIIIITDLSLIIITALYTISLIVTTNLVKIVISLNEPSLDLKMVCWFV